MELDAAPRRQNAVPREGLLDGGVDLAPQDELPARPRRELGADKRIRARRRRCSATPCDLNGSMKPGPMSGRAKRSATAKISRPPISRATASSNSTRRKEMSWSGCGVAFGLGRRPSSRSAAKPAASIRPKVSAVGRRPPWWPSCSSPVRKAVGTSAKAASYPASPPRRRSTRSSAIVIRPAISGANPSTTGWLERAEAASVMAAAPVGRLSARSSRRRPAARYR
jgi:hypothetical protein